MLNLEDGLYLAHTHMCALAYDVKDRFKSCEAAPLNRNVLNGENGLRYSYIFLF